ncbi:hypothetical protein [Grimontia marina]|uniref:Uncharacterized protein n=1 Tax=Grimontia marina TaxID=646534 RepID=A0A128FJS6_9GAMM|nr:hypothetical protein [Grimontia marina]CZF87043.1 hypothetical protein GMA8713_05085 [Grimontia marina]
MFQFQAIPNLFTHIFLVIKRKTLVDEYGSPIACDLNIGKTQATCTFEIPRFSYLTESERSQLISVPIRICGDLFCYNKSDQININLQYREENPETLIETSEILLSNRVLFRDPLAFSTYHNSFISYTEYLYDQAIAITSVDGRGRIIIPLYKRFDLTWGPIHVDEETGTIFITYTSGDSSSLIKIVPDLDTPKNSTRTSYDLSTLDISSTAIIDDSFFASGGLNGIHLSETDIDDGTRIKVNTTTLGESLNITDNSKKLYAVLVDGNGSSTQKIVRYNNNIRDSYAKSISYSLEQPGYIYYETPCNEILSEGDYIFDSCGNRFLSSDNAATDLTIRGNIPKPPWYSDDLEHYELRKLVGVKKLESSGYLYAERSSFSCYPECSNYVTIANEQHSKFKEYWVPNKISRLVGAYQDNNGNIWISGRTKNNTFIAIKVQSPTL